MAAPLELQTDEVLQTAMVTLQDVYVYVCLYKILTFTAIFKNSQMPVGCAQRNLWMYEHV